MSTSQIYYLDMKGTSQVDYLDTKSTSQLESLKEVKDIYLGLSSSAKCYCVSHHQSTNSIIFTVQSYHTSSFRWLAWPRVACSPPCCGRYQGPAWWLLPHLSQSYLSIHIYSDTSHLSHYLCWSLQCIVSGWQVFCVSMVVHCCIREVWDSSVWYKW